MTYIPASHTSVSPRKVQIKIRRQHEAALDAAVQAVSVRPDWRPSLETLACCYVAQDRAADARRCMEQAAELSPPPGDALKPLLQQSLHGRSASGPCCKKLEAPADKSFAVSPRNFLRNLVDLGPRSALTQFPRSASEQPR